MDFSTKYFLPSENGFRGAMLDTYLEAGYYRMQHMVFTTHCTQIDYEGNGIPVFWLRTWVDKIHESKSAKAIRSKGSGFKIFYKKAEVNEETEALYLLYKNHVNFSISASSFSYLHQYGLDNPFNSWMVEIRDGKKLIAVGYFDKGRQALAGILNFYHPNYAKYSLGKLLILSKIDYANRNQIPLYYTGYISSTITKFDYKIFPDINAIEVYLPIENIWAPYKYFGKEKLQEYFIKYIKDFC